MHLTRWQRFYAEDPRIATTPPSACARWAAEAFRRHGARTVLDLGCGAGRDMGALAAAGVRVAGADAARAGLDLAGRLLGSAEPVPGLVEADARRLPFAAGSFDGVYCFGLLHEFVDETAEADVRRVMAEIGRVLQPAGLLALAVLSGEPSQGLPHVRLFTEQMLAEAARGFRCLQQTLYDDTGCTGMADYHIWRGLYAK